MNLNRLRYFVVTAEELHFGRAADRLHMAQPPLSQQIKLLEKELGLTLFNRSTRRVTLTEAGEVLYPAAQRLLVEADGVDRRMSAFRSGDGGVLRLGFVDSASYEVMPRFLRSFRGRWPAVDYELHSMSSDEQHVALVRGEIDLGLARHVGAGREVEGTVVLQEALVVAVAADHRLARQKRTSLKRLVSETFIGFDRQVSPSLHAELTALFSRRAVGYDPIIEATEYTTILGLVASGHGIAVVPAGVQTFQPPSLRYIGLTDRDATSSLLLLTRRGERSPLVERAGDVVSEMFTPAGSEA